MTLILRPIAAVSLVMALCLAAPARAADDDGGNSQRLAVNTTVAAIPATKVNPTPAAPVLVRDPRSAAGLVRTLGDAGIAVPAGGVEAACAGFPTLFRCLGALHIAKNVRVPGGFEPVREMLLYDPEASLADVARAFAPEVDPVAAEKTAQGQAMADLRKVGITS